MFVTLVAVGTALLLGGVGLGFALAARRWASAAVVGLALVLFVSLWDGGAVALGPVSLNDMAVGGCLVGVIWARGWHLALNRVLLGMGLYAAAIAVSNIAAASDPGSSVMAVVQFAREIAIVLVIVNLTQTLSDLRRVSAALVGATGVLALTAVVGWFTGHQLHGIARLYTGYVANGQSGSRLASIGADPDIFGQLLVLMLPLAWYWSRRGNRWTSGSQLVWLGLAEAIVLALVLTFSRGAFVALVLMLALEFRERWTRRATIVPLGLALLLIALATPASYWSRVGSTLEFVGGGSGAASVAASDQSLDERSKLWQVGAAMFVEHPLTGVGMNNYGPRYVDYFQRVDPNLPCCPAGAHNVLVRVAAETGLVGLASILFAIGLCVRGAYAAARRLVQLGLSEDASLLRSLCIGLCGYIVTALFLDGQYPRAFWMVVALVAAGTQVVDRLSFGPSELSSAPRPPVSSVAV